jgi:hypothetical protein
VEVPKQWVGSSVRSSGDLNARLKAYIHRPNYISISLAGVGIGSQVKLVSFRQ